MSQPQNEGKAADIKIKTLLIVVQMTILYVLTISPSPVLSFIASDLDLYNNNTALVLPITIAYPMSAIFAIVGGLLLSKINLEKLFSISCIAGILCGVVLLSIQNYAGLMINRLLFSISYGISIPLLGAAISSWYSPRAKDTMNTLNGFYPWVGALLAYFVAVPLYKAMNNSWAFSISFWSLLLIPIFLLWVIIIAFQGRKQCGNTSGKSTGLKMYFELLRYREIRAITLIYTFDFGFYAYFSAIYSLFLIEGTGLPEQEANMLASISFPVVGLIFSVLGGVVSSRTGKRKPLIASGQLIKFIGILLAMLTIRYSIVISLIGIAIFTIGNSAYLPPMFMVPMDMHELNSDQVGCSFSLFMAAGMVLGGTIAPVLGGKLVDIVSGIINIANPIQQHFQSLIWSVLILNTLNLAAFFVATFKLQETGPAFSKCKNLH